jgi:prepilin-type N-terminal cleavage/methylation domain-containing protein
MIVMKHLNLNGRVTSLISSVRTASAFTIIELLVVIGIISVLAVALLVTLNPAEAQRRSRDAARLKDANTLQAVIEQYLNDGNSSVCETASGCSSAGAGTGITSQPCSASWITAGTGTTAADLCAYAKTVPVDPSNNTTRACAHGASCLTVYRIIMASGNYEITVRQESTQNNNKQINDGGATTGAQTQWVQIYSGNAGLFGGSGY